MGHRVWEKDGEFLSSYDSFTEMFLRVFDHSPKGREVGEQLLTVKQGKQRVAEYALKFHTLAAGSGWNEPVFKAAFH